MSSSHQDTIAFLVEQRMIDEGEGFDYREHEFKELFDFIFHFASGNLLTESEAGIIVPMNFYISSEPFFHAKANYNKHYIALSRGLIENLNYALTITKKLPARLEHSEEILGRTPRQFILEICCKFVFYHEKAHIDHQAKPVDLSELGSTKMREPVNFIDEFDEDLYAVKSIDDDIISEYGESVSIDTVAELIVTALNIFFITMAYDHEEREGTPFKPPLHLRYTSCLLYLFKCLEARGKVFSKTSIENIIRQAKETCGLICADHLHESNQKLYYPMKNASELEKEIHEWAGKSSRFPELDLSIIALLSESIS